MTAQTLYLQHAGSACILRTERTKKRDYEVKLTKYVTRRYNGNTYTIMKITLPKELVLYTGIQKGDIVNIYDSRKGIRLEF